MALQDELDALCARADTALAEGDVATAITLYVQVLDEHGKHSGASIGIARAYVAAGRLGDAEQAYVKSVQVDAADVQRWVELIRLEYDHGAVDAAKANLAAALRTVPGDPRLLELNREIRPEAAAANTDLQPFRAALIEGRDEDARAMLATFEAADPHSPPTLIAQAELHLMVGDGKTTALIHALNRAHTQHPGNWELRSALGRLYLLGGPLRNVRMGTGLCEDAWRTSGESTWAALGLAECFLAGGEDRLAAGLIARLQRGDDLAATWAARFTTD